MDIDEIPTFDFPENKLFGLEIIKNDVKYEFLIRFSDKNDKLIGFGGSGRIDRKKHNLPFFQRHSWQNQFEESVIYFADPTFYIDSKLAAGWFMGTEDDWYLKTICEIIKKIVENRNIKYENILFYGTSSSGFAAVMLATMIKDSTALVGNFNYDIFKTHFQRLIDNLKEICFNGLDEDTIIKKYGYRVNIVELFKKMDYIPPIIYHVNVNSDVDLIDQCLPFIRSLSETNINSSENDIEVIICHDDNGHRSRVSFIEAYPLIKLILDRKLYKYYNSAMMQPITHQQLNNCVNNNKNLKKKIKQQEKVMKKSNIKNSSFTDKLSKNIMKFIKKIVNKVKK